MNLSTVLLATAFAGLAILVPPADAAERPIEKFSTSAGEVRITPVRHASLMIEAEGKVIDVDPWSQGSYEGLPKADLILITDIHPDHLDPKQIAAIQKAGTKIIGPKAVADQLPGVEVLSNGASTEWEKWKIEAIPMYNLKRGPAPGKFFHDKGRGNGYVLTYGGKRFYIAGDTEGVPEMRALKNIDVAFIPMNLPYTMPPDEAADAVKAFHPKIVYPYHYKGSDLKVFEQGLAGTGIDVRSRDWYY
jgi:L-ascorbate metabolism protein UlaG (beta-lactamase superfamily)